MRVGIIGYWYATNYGSACTYYGLYKTLKKLGHDPIIIDMPEKEREPFWDKSFSRHFIEGRCNVSESVKWGDVSNLNELCDAFLIGSDQVWNRDGFKISRGLFFLNFVDSSKMKLAYAPSFGADNMILDSSLEKDLATLLSKFDKISVREDVGASLLKKRYGLDADVVLDPALLLSAEDYGELEKECSSDLPEHYALAYILDPTPDKEQFIEKIVSKYDCPVILVLDGRTGTFEKNVKKLTKFADRAIDLRDVSSWLRHIADADVVITDSFHGMALSIVHEKPLYVYANHGRGYARFTSLLNKLDLQKILYENSAELTDARLNDSIPYKKIRRRILDESLKSIKWLDSALKTKCFRKVVTKNINVKISCFGCGCCSEVCSKNAIRIEKNADGFYNPVVNLNLCSDCGICSERCPAIHVYHKNSESPVCYALLANDDLRSCSSSGGAFTLFSKKVFEKNGVVCGASFDSNFSVRHIVAHDMDELSSLRGSKYMQSNLGSIYTDVKNLLNRGTPVLFSGMPCQIAGLYKYLGKNYDDLITIDLLCHGISSGDVFEKYRLDVLEGKVLTDLQFKSKKPWGWHAGINASFKDGSHYSCIIEKDPYFRAYIKGLSRNKACHSCPYCCVPRQGDLTIGDFWKIKEYDATLDDNLGTSVVLVNNEKGQKLFDECVAVAKKVVDVPLSYAVSGNGCIKYPYALNKHRDIFFDKLWYTDFKKLVDDCLNDFPRPRPVDFPYRYNTLYDLAHLAYLNRGNRSIAIWGDNEVLRKIMKKYFDMDVEFVIYNNSSSLVGGVRSPKSLENNSNKYYLINYDAPYSVNHERVLSQYGYVEGRDYVYRIHKPIVLKDLDLSKGYRDSYGNIISGFGVIGKVILHGFNNRIFVGKDVHGLQNVSLDLTANSRIFISNGALFTQPGFEINVQGYDGDSLIRIGDRCRFMDNLIRVFNDLKTTVVTIGVGVTFGAASRIHANSGKRIVINRDSMISRDVVFWAGDGHSIFDVRTGANINYNPSRKTSLKDLIVLDEHVWAGDGALFLSGSIVGRGSIVGAKSSVKKVFPNNCSVVGNPSHIARKDVAWSTPMASRNISSCGPYANYTKEDMVPISGQNVLVIGGTRNNGIYLVKELIKRGNVVTIANRGRTPDNFGDSVNRIRLEVTNKESIELALSGKYFDVVFNNIAYSSNSVRNILNTVECGVYVQLSSIMVYKDHFENMSEECYDPLCEEVVWTNATADYAVNKRNAEIAALQKYDGKRIVVVRVPFVVPTDKLDYIIDHILEGRALNSNDIDKYVSLISVEELSLFLTWVATQDFAGIVNISSNGAVLIRDMISHIEKMTNAVAILSEDGDKIPFPTSSFYLNTDRIKDLGFVPKDVNDWFWDKLNWYIDHNVGNRKL